MKTAYEISNKIQSVSLNRFRTDLSHDFLKCNESVAMRGKAAQNLLDYLCDKFKINRCLVMVRNKPQLHNTSNGKLTKKIYGRYYPLTHTIELYNLTAIRKTPVAIATMYDTLLHEFMHHYDFEKLKLSESLHTAGFYKRITDLKNKLN